jgi:hypothetical protein
MHIYKMWKSALASQWTFLTPVVRVDGTSSTAELRDIEVKASSPERKAIAKHFFAQLISGAAL